MMDGMIVVPKCTGILLVRVVVVLVLTRLGYIFRPAIKRGARVGTVEVNRICKFGIVDEANDGLSVFRHDKGRPGRDTIVSNKLGSLWQIWVNLMFKRLDLNLIILNLLPSDRTCNIPEIFCK